MHPFTIPRARVALACSTLWFAAAAGCGAEVSDPDGDSDAVSGSVTATSSSATSTSSSAGGGTTSSTGSGGAAGGGGGAGGVVELSLMGCAVCGCGYIEPVHRASAIEPRAARPDDSARMHVDARFAAELPTRA